MTAQLMVIRFDEHSCVDVIPLLMSSEQNYI